MADRGREAARKVARQSGLARREVEWYANQEAQRLARESREGKYPEVAVVPRNKPPVVATFGARIELEDGRYAAVSGEIAIARGGAAVIRSMTIKPDNPRDEFDVTGTYADESVNCGDEVPGSA